MIISRTPFRVSFFGGGTDYPSWYRENAGAVLATTIDKYCYITCRYLPPFFEHKNRIVYSQIETVDDVSEIDHPSVRESLRFMNIKGGVEIHYDGDLPARTGLGSSSSFTVGLLHCLYALKGLMPSNRQLAHDAIHIEQNILRENVGSQDQASAAFGGFNLIEFGGSNTFEIHSVTVDRRRLRLLNDHLMLFFTGFSRYASEIAAAQIKNIPNRKQELAEMYGMVGEGLNIIQNCADISEFGRLLDESWQIKRRLSDNISSPTVDEIYAKARSVGALGGKLLGAGGGGFMLIFAPPSAHAAIKRALDRFLHVPFRFENSGSQVIFYDPDSQRPYPQARNHRRRVQQAAGGGDKLVSSKIMQESAAGAPPDF